jgi:hypothetical protein
MCRREYFYALGQLEHRILGLSLSSKIPESETAKCLTNWKLYYIGKKGQSLPGKSQAKIKE